MSRHRLAFLLAGLAILGISLACGMGSAAEPVEQSAPVEAPVGEPAEAPTLPEPTAAEVPAPEAPPPAPIPIIIQPTAVVPAPQTAPAVLESRRLTLEWPQSIRVGDADRIRLTLEMDDQGNLVPTAVVAGNQVSGNVIQIPNLYETHTVIAEARLDLAGVEVQPDELVEEPLLPGQPVTFYWSVRPTSAGRYVGTINLHLRFLPRAEGEESRLAISTQPVEINATTFLGFGGGTVRFTGAIGSVVGTVLGFPFLDDALRWIWGRLKRGRRP